MATATRRLRFVLVAGSVLLALSEAATVAQKGRPAPGNGLLVVGSYPSQFSIIDEATGKIVSTIPFKSGIPRRTILTRDRKQLYVVDATTEKVEILDLASRKTLDAFTLSEGNTRVRIRSLEPDPLQRFAVMVTVSATKLIDRFSVGTPTIQQYDLAAHKVIRTIPWPDGEERQNVQVMFSPNGKLMYLFTEQDVLIYETDAFTQVDKWELSRPIEEGLGRLEFGPRDVLNDEPGFYTAIFNMSDPVQHRRIMGIGRVNLAEKTVDFHSLGPSTSVSFSMAPDRKVGYGLFVEEIGHYEFWKFDLERHRVMSRTEFKGRPRMALKTSSNGSVLYIYQAGNTIDLYDARTFEYMRTITLDGDMTTELFVLPASSASTF